MLSALATLLSLAAPVPELEVARALAEAPAGASRAVAATRALVGLPYVLSPLGEGAGRDPDPRFRLDAFDCMTLVETAVALGSAATVAEARLALDDVRYGGPPSWAARNHEVVSQWLPSNVARGFVADATSSLTGVAVLRPAKEHTPASWDAVRAAGRGIPGLARARLPLGRFEVPAIAPGDVGRVERQLPDGAIVFVLRVDAPERATRVTHAGLVVRGPGGAALVRHATSTKGVERVIEEPLERFVRRQERAFPRWPLEGFSFWAIRDASDRVRALAARPVPAPAAAEASPAPPPRRL